MLKTAVQSRKLENGLGQKKKVNKIKMFSNMDELEIIILCEVSQTKTNTVFYHLYVGSKI